VTRIRTGLATVVLLGCGRPLLPGFTQEESTSEDGALGESGGDEATPDFEAPPSLEVVQLSAGAHHVCGLWVDLGVHCWGGGWLGQLGDGQFENASKPQPVVGLGLDVLRLGAGQFHSCATLESGEAMCWGHNLWGALGNGNDEDSSQAVPVQGLLGPAVSVSGGAAHLHTCAMLEDKTLMCWGENSKGQLGDGTTIPASKPQPVIALDDVHDFAIGYIHSCAVDVTGQVSCWGWNPHGLIDTALPLDAFVSSPWPKAGLTDIVELGAGNHHACALHADGRVSCWGYEGYGQLGDGSDQAHGDPLPVADLLDAVAIASGTTHNCALRSGGTIACWGYNFAGQLGDGTTTARSTPVLVIGIDDAIAVTVGENFTCALSDSQGPLCWGLNANGQLGDGTNDDSVIPVAVLPPS
jgi:alpha-tubulin suppressor-like RCC1 family protein